MTGHVLRAIGIIKLASGKTMTYEKRIKYIADAKVNMDQAIKLLAGTGGSSNASNEASLSYIRGLLKFCQHSFY